jgi:hypothetical protein
MEQSGGALLAGITEMTLSRLALCQYRHPNVKRGKGQVAFKPMKNKYIFVWVIACCYWSAGAGEACGKPDELTFWHRSFTFKF